MFCAIAAEVTALLIGWPRVNVAAELSFAHFN
jgi:hypothetical protein